MNSLLMQPIVAVPSFICADAFHKFLPFATGFAAGCMIWIVVAEVLPDGFKVICLNPLNFGKPVITDVCSALYSAKGKKEKTKEKEGENEDIEFFLKKFTNDP